MENKKYFRKSLFGGFKKSDVLDYIESITDSTSEKESDLLNQMNTSIARQEELFEQSTQTEQQLTRALDLMREKDQQLQSVQQQMIELEAQIEKEKQRYEVLHKKNTELESALNSYRQQFAQQEEVRKNEAQASEKILKALMDARVASDLIVTQAEEQARDYTDRAAVLVMKVRNSLVVFKSEIEKIAANVRPLMQSVENSSISISDQLRSSIDGLQRLSEEAIALPARTQSAHTNGLEREE